jgi:hypothetical protein
MCGIIQLGIVLYRICDTIISWAEDSHSNSPNIYIKHHNKMSKTCIYCGSAGKLTKEHIWPNAIIDHCGMEFTHNPRNLNFHKGDPVIKDVCGSCNSTLMQPLDNYIIMLTKSHFSKDVLPGQAVSFTFNFDLLFRTLLRISFNSARAQCDDQGILKYFNKIIPYIIGTRKRPSGTKLRLQIVTSSRAINTTTGETKIFRHDMFRSATLNYMNNKGSKFRIRLVAIKSYWFYIIFPVKKFTKDEEFEFIKGFKEWRIQPGVSLQPHLNEINIPVEKTTYMHPSLLDGLFASFQNFKEAQQGDAPDARAELFSGSTHLAGHP